MQNFLIYKAFFGKIPPPSPLRSTQNNNNYYNNYNNKQKFLMYVQSPPFFATLIYWWLPELFINTSHNKIPLSSYFRQPHSLPPSASEPPPPFSSPPPHFIFFPYPYCQSTEIYDNLQTSTSSPFKNPPTFPHTPISHIDIVLLFR